jgi:hypothetical protein
MNTGRFFSNVGFLEINTNFKFLRQHSKCALDALRKLKFAQIESILQSDSKFLTDNLINMIFFSKDTLKAFIIISDCKLDFKLH